jgi:hypothetical protein
VHPAWTVERPGYGLAIAIIGAVLAVVGGLVLDWAAGAGLADIRQVARQSDTPYSVITQLYVRVLYLPLLSAVIVTGLLAAVGHVVARAAIGVAGVLIGLGLVAAVVWVELGNLGSTSGRRDALPLLLLVAAVGVASILLGGGAVFEESALQARTLAATLAGLALILQLSALSDVGDTVLGAWCAVVGFALLVIAPVIPHRRIMHGAR